MENIEIKEKNKLKKKSKFINDEKKSEKIYDILSTIVIVISVIVGYNILPHITSSEIEVVKESIIYANDNYDGTNIIELSNENVTIKEFSVTEIEATYGIKTEIVTGYLKDGIMNFKVQDSVSTRLSVSFGILLGMVFIYSIIGLKIFHK